MGITQRGLHRAHCVNVDLNKPYRYGNRFRVKPSSPEAWNNDDIDLGYDEVREHSREYRTVFGPCFANSSVMYECNNTGLRGALRRLTCVRKPDIIGLHERLRDNQYKIREYLGAHLVRWISRLRDNCRLEFGQLRDAEDERRLWTHNPHPKRRLREGVERDVHFDGRESHAHWLRKVNYKCKPGELLPVGKYLRGVGDLTTPGSAKAGYLMDCVKEAFSQVFYYAPNQFSRFIKTPDRDILKNVFEDLINPIDVAFYYFSDDSCIGIRCADGVYCANLDISACDGSNYDPIFEILKEVMSCDSRFNGDVSGAFRQCLLPFRVRSMKGTPKRWVEFTPLCYTLYSGSVLTTSINNVANSMIFLSIMMRLPPIRDRRVSAISELISGAAESVGYIVTMEECANHAQLQFLKHSPAIVDGEVVPWLNIGTMLRSFGTFRGDLPGSSKISVQRRAAMFNSDVVKSFVHCGEHVIHDALKTHVIEESHGVEFEQTRIRSFGGSNSRIPCEQICLRYGLSSTQVFELCEYIEGAGFGDLVQCDALAQIFKIDYGL